MADQTGLNVIPENRNVSLRFLMRAARLRPSADRIWILVARYARRLVPSFWSTACYSLATIDLNVRNLLSTKPSACLEVYFLFLSCPTSFNFFFKEKRALKYVIGPVLALFLFVRRDVFDLFNCYTYSIHVDSKLQLTFEDLSAVILDVQNSISRLDSEVRVISPNGRIYRIQVNGSDYLTLKNNLIQYISDECEPPETMSAFVCLAKKYPNDKNVHKFIIMRLRFIVRRKL